MLKKTGANQGLLSNVGGLAAIKDKLLQPTQPTSGPADLNQLYSNIKNLEDAFPIPTPTAVVDVGTFNANSGVFFGLISTLEDVPEELVTESPAPNPKPQKIRVPPVVDVDAVNVELEFKLSNSQAGFSVITNGIESVAPPGQTALRVNLARANDVNWTIRAGNKVYSDRLLVQRPPIIGAGAFTIPVLPIAVVYEPPMDNRRLNRASYTISQSRGSVARVSFTTSNQQTTPVVGKFQTVNTIQSLAKNGAALLKLAGKSKAAEALTFLANSLGQASSSQTTGTSVTGEHSLGMIGSQQLAVTTDSKSGPGSGDVIHFLHNARLVWLADGSDVHLALLGQDRNVAHSVRTLQLSAGELGLEPEELAALLSLDPFVAGGPQANLDPKRFVYVLTLSPGGSVVQTSEALSVTLSSQRATTHFSTQAQDFKAGSLSFLGIGVTESVAVQNSISHTSALQESSTFTQKIDAAFHAEEGEFYFVDIYYDSVFGTYAFQRSEAGQQTLLSGTVQNSLGVPLPGRLVNVTDGTRRLATVSDSRGRWSFPTPVARPIRAGMLTVSSGKIVRQLDFSGAPLTGIVLR
jgi:hypothetical protein